MPRPGPEFRLSAKFLLSTTHTRLSFNLYTTVRSKNATVYNDKIKENIVMSHSRCVCTHER